MKKLLLISSLLILVFACKNTSKIDKTENVRETTEAPRHNSDEQSRLDSIKAYKRGLKN